MVRQTLTVHTSLGPQPLSPIPRYGIVDNELTDRMFEIYSEENEVPSAPRFFTGEFSCCPRKKVLMMFMFISSQVTFDRLVAALCDFRTAPPEKQCRMLFRLMDNDDGGTLGRMEIFHFLACRLKHVETTTASGDAVTTNAWTRSQPYPRSVPLTVILVVGRGDGDV